MLSLRFERFDASFCGAGDTLSAALAALLASGEDIETASREALGYLDRCLDGGFRPGMGQALPDRMFWAQIDTDSAEAEPDAARAASAESFGLPRDDTRH
jgi:hydroxymethylpyrimidine/phosphomethylpyrimidine kinase